MRNILLATNFSENSLIVVDYAIKLFKNAKINSNLLNTVYEGVLEDNNVKIQSLAKKLALENTAKKINF